MAFKYSPVAISGFFMAATCLLNAAPAQAARIYNELNDSVCVDTIHSHGCLNLAPGQRSGSLEWNDGVGFKVDVLKANSDESEIKLPCDWSKDNSGLFNLHELIVGGNYMVIWQTNTTVYCTICNAHHGIISQQSGGGMPYALESSHKGC